MIAPPSVDDTKIDLDTNIDLDTKDLDTKIDLKIDLRKAELRRQAVSRRDGIPAAERAAAAETLAGRTFPIPITSGVVVSGYSPLKSELNPLPLMRRCAVLGARLALPVVVGRGKPLTMRAFVFGETLGSGVWGIREPLPDAPEVLPDILLVPLLAFDRRGNRIGYGAGYYDRTIARLRELKTITAIGVAFSAQEFEDVPTTSRDARLDLVLTERGVVSDRKG
jgi:5-formyltetrahydrofolate cyclo-ligase